VPVNSFNFHYLLIVLHCIKYTWQLYLRLP